MRKTIARRLAESKFTAPHFYLSLTIDMDAAMVARKAINDETSPCQLQRHGCEGWRWRSRTTRLSTVGWRPHSLQRARPHWRGRRWKTACLCLWSHANVKSFGEIGLEVRVCPKRKQKPLRRLGRQHLHDFDLGMFGIDEFTAISTRPMRASLQWWHPGGACGARRRGGAWPHHEGDLERDHRVVDGRLRLLGSR